MVSSQRRDAAAIAADMQQQRHVHVLSGPPQLLVDGVAVGPLPEGRRRDEDAYQPHLGAVLHLGARLVHVVHVENTDAFEPIGVGLAELGYPIVIRAAGRGDNLVVVQPVPEEALTGLGACRPDPVHLQLFEHLVRVVGRLAHVIPESQKVDFLGVIEPLTGLDEGAQHAGLLAVHDPYVVVLAALRRPALYSRGPVSQPRLEPRGVQVGWLDDMCVRRNHLVVAHGAPPPSSPPPQLECPGK